VRIDELKDVASEPHQFNVYMVTNFSTQTQNIANRLTNAFCNSKKNQYARDKLCERLHVKDLTNLNQYVVDLTLLSNCAPKVM